MNGFPASCWKYYLSAFCGYALLCCVWVTWIFIFVNYCLFERLTNWDQVFQVGAIKELFFLCLDGILSLLPVNYWFTWCIVFYLGLSIKLLFCLLFFSPFNWTRVSSMLGMHLIGSDVQVISIFCRSWRNLVILVGSILKLSLVNVSMNSCEDTVMWKVTCAQVME